MIGVLSKREKYGHRDTEGKDKHVKIGRDLSSAAINQGTPKIVCNHQKLERARKELSPEPSPRAWPYWHLGFPLRASKTVRESIPVVFSHPVCGPCFTVI